MLSLFICIKHYVLTLDIACALSLPLQTSAHFFPLFRQYTRQKAFNFLCLINRYQVLVLPLIWQLPLGQIRCNLIPYCSSKPSCYTFFSQCDSGCFNSYRKQTNKQSGSNRHPIQLKFIYEGKYLVQLMPKYHESVSQSASSFAMCWNKTSLQISSIRQKERKDENCSKVLRI